MRNGCFHGLRFLSSHCAECPRWVASRRWAVADEFHRLNGEKRPRVCEKSYYNETVGKLFTFPLRLAMKQDEEWDCASKSGVFVSIFSTGNMTPDFSHSLGRVLPFGAFWIDWLQCTTMLRCDRRESAISGYSGIPRRNQRAAIHR